MKRCYAGIGSRSTPEDVLVLMEATAHRLGRDGWTLRSGGADGADSAFERGAMRAMDLDLLEPWPEVYLPWPNFNGRPDGPDAMVPQHEAFNVASRHHPAWHRLSPWAKMLHARNVHQILGGDVNRPRLSAFVACWTPDGKGGGGTGQALRVAKSHGVPIFDLGDPAVLLTFQTTVWTFAAPQ